MTTTEHDKPTTSLRHLPLGRRPASNKRALALRRLLTGTVPTPPGNVDYGARFTGWQVLGNDRAGDCVAVTWANQRALVTASLAAHLDYPDQDQVWTIYKTQNPTFDPNGTPTTNGPGSRSDGGMDIQTLLQFLNTSGGPDGVKAVAFARVDHTNEAELRAAHAIFGQVWYGITVLDVNQGEFAADKIWDYVATSPVDGRHSVTGVGYDTADYRFITWGRETDWTESYRQHLVDEAWVVIWPEQLGTAEFMQGIDVEQLADDYQAITGRPLPLPDHGVLWHTIRYPDGSWQQAGNAEGAAHIAGSPTVVAAAPSGGAVQFMVATIDGRLWHTIRSPSGAWQNAGDAKAAAHIVGTPVALAAAPALGDAIQFLVATNDGGLWHTVRQSSGAWQPAGDAKSAVRIAGTPIALAAAPGEDGSQFMVATSDGRLWHTIRHPNGAWQQAGDAHAAAKLNGSPIALTASPGPDGVQYMIATADGKLWHTIRHPNGDWQPAGDARAAMAIGGTAVVVATAAAPAPGGDVEFVVATADGELWHSIRHADGSWTPAGNAKAASAMYGTPTSVAAATDATGEVQFVVAAR